MLATKSFAIPSHEVLAKLAAEDPAAYERLRRQTIEGFIDNAPPRIRRRLRGIQFRIDHLRRLSRTPLQSVIAISDLMWESLDRLNDELQDLVRISRHREANPAPVPAVALAPARSARIIEFRPRNEPGRGAG